MKGHYTPNPLWTNEVWGLCTFYDDEDKYLTCSDDATLRLYSASKRKMLKYLKLDVNIKGKPLKWVKLKGFKGKGMPTKATARAIGISIDNKIVAVGMKDGTVVVVNINKWKIKKIFRHSK